jgi:fructuronate reductase
VTDLPRLSRTTSPDVGPIPPVRIVHMGLGAFHRAHQAWYTAHSSDAADWGIVAITGRSPDAAVALAAQDGLFTLVERGPLADRFEIIRSIVDAHPGSDLRVFIDLLARRDITMVTMTLTEAGYRLGHDGLPDLTDAAVAADIAILRAALADSAGDSAAASARLRSAAPSTALARLLLGLEGRRRADGPGIAIVPCDNLPDNGSLVQHAVQWLANEVSPSLATWIGTHTSFVSTSVDRITPHPTDSDRAEVQRLIGLRDEVAVVTEPFSDWVLCGAFPSGRPEWESAGARFVDDIRPWEDRKLWMLNGAHSALAALGAVRGRRLVSEAIADPVCLELVNRLWDEDARHLPDLDLVQYRASLLERFANPRIEHRLDQIAQDAATKLRVRIVPVAAAERSAGRSAEGCAAVLGAWVLAVRHGHSRPPKSSSAHGSPDTWSAQDFVAYLDPRLGADTAFCAAVDSAAARLNAHIAHRTPSADPDHRTNLRHPS